ncbi:MAG: hypothetical protein M3Z46_05220, partial [Actinomycetota bacterium]|nr:hypothetical protein [Actinomycetota bacterium]
MGESPGAGPPTTERCPNCGAVMSSEQCSLCGLRLVGPTAARLWSVDEALHRLRLERQSLIHTLQVEASTAWPPAPVPQSDPVPHAWTPPPPPHWVPPTRPAGTWPTGGGSDAFGQWPEAGDAPALPPTPMRGGSEFPGDPASPPLQIQTVLLSLGAFSLIVAAVVFLAVTWRGLSAPARSVTLVGLTAVFAGITTLLRRRSLTSTAEALAAVTVMLGLADAYAVRIGAFPGSGQLMYWGVACAVLSFVVAGFARLSGAVGARLASVLLIQLPAPLLAAERSASQTLLLGTLLLQALLIVGVVRRRSDAGSLVTRILCAGGALAWIIGAAGAGTVAIAISSQRCVAAGLLAAAGVVAAVVAWQWPGEEDLQRIAAGLAAASVLASLATLAARWLDGDAVALTTVALGVVLASVAARTDRRWASGPVAVATLVAIGATAPSWVHLGVALRAPWWAQSQLGEWSVAAGRSARAVGVPATIGSGFGPALASVGLLVAGGLGLRARIGAPADWALAALGCLAVSTVPLADDVPVWSATVFLLGAAVLASAFVLWRIRSGDARDASSPWWALALVSGGQGLAWALLTPGLTLVALTAIAVTAAATAAVGVRHPASRVVHAAALVMSMATAAMVPVAARLFDLSPEVGWTALAVLAAGSFAMCFAAWYRAIGRRAEAVAAVATVTGGVAAVSYVAGALGAGLLLNRGGAPGMLAVVFGAGAVCASFIAAVSVRHRFAVIPEVATVVGSLLGLAAVGTGAAQAGLDPAGAWLAVVAAATVVA